jgi:hypothetical protein
MTSTPRCAFGEAWTDPSTWMTDSRGVAAKSWNSLGSVVSFLSVI